MPIQAPTDTLNFTTLSVASTSTIFGASTGYALEFCTIINNGDANITISNSGDAYATNMALGVGQGITFTPSNNSVLPELKITTGSGTTLVSVIHN